MISLEFVDKPPRKKTVMAKMAHKMVKNPFLDEACRCKPHDAILDIMMQEDEGMYRLLLVQLKEMSLRSIEEVGAALFKKANEGIDDTLVIDLKECEKEGLPLLTGFLLASWRFHKYRTTCTSEEKINICNLKILCTDPREMQQNFQRISAMIEGVNFARALTSEPANVLYPAAYAERLLELEKLGVEVEILDVEQLRKIGMTAILAVGKGSPNTPVVAILKWNGANNEAPICVVGKGVCFDSGGICLKPVAHQLEMKWDKAGAGVVAGLIKTLALAKVKKNVVGVVGLVENMPDGAATKPGDVIYTMSGQTVEIADTDAEGRLVLADCLWYAQQRFKPKVLIDLGTLTMETFASLGNAYAGLYCNDGLLTQALKKAGEKSGEYLWELPMGPFFAKQIESSVADIKNLGVNFCGENGAAAEFLRRFVQDIPWAHIDIAGVSWSKEELPILGRGVTGFGVRFLEEWILNQK